MFFQFCDALEVKDGVSAGPQGWGLDNAIYSWGDFWNTTYYDYGRRSPLFLIDVAELDGKVCGDEGAEYVSLRHSRPDWLTMKLEPVLGRITRASHTGPMSP
jgi:hypothetical protein